MEHLYSITLQTHIISIFTVLLVTFIQLLITKMPQKERAFKYLHILLPLHYCILACIFFTGVLLLFLTNDWIIVFCMVILWIFILVSSIKTYKWMKAVRQDSSLSGIILNQIRKKYLIDIILLALLSLMS